MRSGLLGFITLALHVASVEHKPCCQGKCSSGYTKYWSLAKGLDGTPHCGEACMSSYKYELYHLFEWNLTEANNTDTPCKDFGFTKYDSPQTHGFGPVKMTLDLYDKPPPPDNRCCVGQCHSGDKYFSITRSEDGQFVCGETCLSSYKYYTIHMVEWNLTWANQTENPCKLSGYPNFKKTVTHSFGVTSVTSDIYMAKPPTPAHQFERGVMAALGYDAGEDCFDDARHVSRDLWGIFEQVRKGGYIAKAKALGELAGEVKTIVETLEQCSTATTDLEHYAKLVKYLEDPRFYTLHNAFTLALNVADDRKMLEAFTSDIGRDDYFAAGKGLIELVLDVIEHPGIPDSNGTAADAIGVGIVGGFGEEINTTCFKDCRVEIPDLVAGVMECLTGVGLVPGLESVFHGLEGLVPTIEDCYHDHDQIMNIVKGFGSFKDPHSLARLVAQNMVRNSIDIGIKVAQAVLAAKGKEWHRFGEVVGNILNEIALNNTHIFEVVV